MWLVWEDSELELGLDFDWAISKDDCTLIVFIPNVSKYLLDCINSEIFRIRCFATGHYETTNKLDLLRTADLARNIFLNKTLFLELVAPLIST